MENYTILLSREGEVPASLAAELGRILDRPVGEVSRGLRDHPWILLKDVEAVHLDAIFDLLGEAGVQVKAVPDLHMPKLGPALRVRDADPLPNAFFLQVAEPPSPAALPWEHLRVVNAGRVTLAPEEIGAIYGAWRGPKVGGGDTTTPGSVPMGGRQETREPFLVDFVAGGEEPLRLRIDAGNFKYDYLGERMQPTSRENFRKLLLDVRRRAPDIFFTRSADALLAGEPVRTHRFRSLRSFEANTLWALQDLEEREAGEAEEA